MNKPSARKTFSPELKRRLFDEIQKINAETLRKSKRLKDHKENAVKPPENDVSILKQNIIDFSNSNSNSDINLYQDINDISNQNQNQNINPDANSNLSDADFSLNSGADDLSDDFNFNINSNDNFSDENLNSSEINSSDLNSSDLIENENDCFKIKNNNKTYKIKKSKSDKLFKMIASIKKPMDKAFKPDENAPPAKEAAFDGENSGASKKKQIEQVNNVKRVKGIDFLHPNKRKASRIVDFNEAKKLVQKDLAKDFALNEDEKQVISLNSRIIKPKQNNKNSKNIEKKKKSQRVYKDTSYIDDEIVDDENLKHTAIENDKGHQMLGAFVELGKAELDDTIELSLSGNVDFSEDTAFLKSDESNNNKNADDADDEQD